MFVIGAFGSVAVSDFVLPAQMGLAVLMDVVVMIGAAGVPVQDAGTPSKPKSAVAASTPLAFELLALPYFLPVRPVTLNWFKEMPLEELVV
jgi:hypothetical protein